MESEKQAASSMPSENTPLLERVPVADQRERYQHHTLRRYCTIGLVTVPLVTLAVVFICIAIGGQTDLFGDHDTSPLRFGRYEHTIPSPSWPRSNGISYEKLKSILLETPDASKAREWSKYYTAGPHLAGKNLSQAEWTRDRWQEWGVEKSEVVAYETYINYPLDHRLALLEDGHVKFEATLEEDVLEEDPTTGLPDRVPAFHGYSANGNVTAQYVFCNYGTYADFEDLVKANVSLEGKIALVKYGAIFRGLKVKRASELGMIGTIIYSDPGDDGEFTEEHGYKPYPEGPARNPSSIQRGSTQYLSVAPGDPTTIGYPSKPGVPRQSVEGKIPDIPSLPLSYAEAIPLLRALNGHGPNASSFPNSWHAGGLGYKGVEYSIGPSPPSLTINLYNAQEYVITPQWDTIGIINGSISDEVIIIGNHRDAWIAGGAVDPNSGSAALNEMVRSFGEALKAGWKPLRTIVFASWDGEEYGLVGSTEWVEEYQNWLSASAVAYVNCDVGVGGSHFNARAAPVLNKLIYDVVGSVASANQTVPGQTVADLWSGHISTMGSGSDFTAFEDYLGVASLDVGFTSGPGDPVYHYHSNYDSFAWMDKYGDAGFEYHATIAKVLALIVAKLGEEPVVSLNATDYSLGLEKYLGSVKALALNSSLPLSATSSLFKPLESAISRFQDTASSFDAHAAHLATLANSPKKPRTPAAIARLYNLVRDVNTKYKLLERQFLYAPGLESRTWFKHVVFAPGLWTGYSGATFPGLVEALDDGDLERTKKWVGILVGTVEKARALLEG